jgi:uncharacterized membrane protein YkvA (DUF1232 family)
VSPRPPERAPSRSSSRRVGPRRKRSTFDIAGDVLHQLRLIPSYLRLLVGLLLDKRVSGMDKLIVAAAIAYVVSPIGIIPDFIPIIGEIDDLFVVTLALQRLIANTPEHVIEEHWPGDPEEISELNVGQALAAAALFLPGRIRRRLRRLTRVSSKG